MNRQKLWPLVIGLITTILFLPGWAGSISVPVLLTPTAVSTARPTSTPPDSITTPTASPTSVQTGVEEPWVDYVVARDGLIKSHTNPDFPLSPGSSAPTALWKTEVSDGTYLYRLYYGDYSDCTGSGHSFRCTGGINIVDAADSTTIVGSYATPDGPSGVALNGNLAYVTWHGADLVSGGGLIILDVSEPTRPVSIGSYPIHVYWATGLLLRPPYAYVLTHHGVEIVDVARPEQPIRVGFYEFPSNYPAYAALSGDKLYLLNENRFLSTCPPDCGRSLHILDVSEPTAPVEVWAYELPSEYQGGTVDQAMAMIDPNLYVPGGDNAWLVFQPNRLLEPTLPSLPSAQPPTLLKLVGHIGDSSSAVAGHGEFRDFHGLTKISDDIYLVDNGQNTLQILDTSRPLTPTITGTTTISSSPLVKIMVDDNQAYVTDRAGLRIIDISDPATPTQIGFYQTSNPISGILKNGNYIYLTGDGLQIVDVSNLTIPLKVGYSDWRLNMPTSLALIKEYLYVNNYNTGLVVDVSDPTTPAKVTNLERASSPLLVKGGYIFNLTPANALRVLDISDPANPAEIKRLETFKENKSLSLVVKEKYAYLATSTAGLRVLDISDPTNPVEIGVADLDSSTVDWGYNLKLNVIT